MQGTQVACRYTQAVLKEPMLHIAKANRLRPTGPDTRSATDALAPIKAVKPASAAAAGAKCTATGLHMHKTAHAQCCNITPRC